MTKEMRKRAIDLLQENIKGIKYAMRPDQIKQGIKVGLIDKNNLQGFTDFGNDKIEVYGEVVKYLKDTDYSFRECDSCTSYRKNGDEEWCIEDCMLFKKYPCDCFEKSER